MGLVPEVQAFWELLRLCGPSSGLPDCRRPSEILVLALDLNEGRPPGVWADALPDVALLVAGIELTVEVINEVGRGVVQAARSFGS